MEGSRLVPSARGMPRGVKAAWLIFAFAVCSVLALVVWGEKEAYAANGAKSNYGYTYYGNLCVKETSWIFQSSNGQLYGLSETEDFRRYTTGCASSRLYNPPDTIAGQPDVYKWIGYWALCYDSGWYKNPQGTYKFGVYTAPLGYQYGRRCGSGYYQTQAQGAAYSYTYSRWIYSPWVWSGYEYYY